MANELKTIQEGVIETLKFTIAFLEKHHLKYIAAYGTVLGAVRHGDIIPWDDDIDIYMPRKDYEKLILLKPELNALSYDIVSLADKGYYLPFAKIVDTKTTLWERKQFPFVLGRYFVDIFPLDDVEGNREQLLVKQKKTLRMFDKYLSSISKYSMKDFYKAFIYRDILTMRAIVHSFILHTGSESYKKKYISYVRSCMSSHSSFLIYLSERITKQYDRSWFEDIIEIPFSDTTIKVPRNYDSYLSLLYGDYHKLPPLEDRKCVHSHYFLDLNHRLTLAEIKNMKYGK